MTVKDFQDKYCWLCGTQSCLGDPEDIQHCGNYHGEIDNLPKIKSFMELFEEEMEEKGITWDDIRKRMEDYYAKKGINDIP